MKIRFYLILLFINFIALAGCTTTSTPYKFYKGELKPEQLSYVKMQRGFGDPSLILKSYDGKDTLKAPAMRDVPQNTFRYEPEMISVESGTHNFGVLFLYIDTPGVLVSNKITTKLSDKYLVNPDLLNAKFATVKHYEELSFNILQNKKYFIKYKFNGNELSYFVEECTKEGNNCINVKFKSMNKKTTVVYSERYPTPSEASKI